MGLVSIFFLFFIMGLVSIFTKNQNSSLAKIQPISVNWLGNIGTV